MFCQAIFPERLYFKVRLDKLVTEPHFVIFYIFHVYFVGKGRENGGREWEKIFWAHLTKRRQKCPLRFFKFFMRVIFFTPHLIVQKQFSKWKPFLTSELFSLNRFERSRKDFFFFLITIINSFIIESNEYNAPNI